MMKRFYAERLTFVTEAAIQQWKNVSDKSVGKVFKALPTRVDLVLSNTEFRFMLESFWGSDLTIIDQARKTTPGRQPLLGLCAIEQSRVGRYPEMPLLFGRCNPILPIQLCKCDS